MCIRWGLDPQHGGLIRHYDVTGKGCPKYFVDYPATWEQFKKDVAAKMVKAENESGWCEEGGGWRYYNGDTGDCVRNNWVKDIDGKWYWFDGAGRMVTNTWYQYKEDWYYLRSDGSMAKGLQESGGKWYYMNLDGKMVTESVTLTPDQDGALRYPGLTE